MKQQIIFIQWPSTAGKSTAVESILENRKRFFHINKDRIKWFISDYSSENVRDRIMLQDMLLSMINISLEKWLSLIVEWQHELIEKISKSENIEIKYINIEAPLSVLKYRFHKRLESVSRWLWKVSNKSEDKLVEIYEKYKKNKFIDWITIDTDKLSKEEVVKEIEMYIDS